MLLGHSKVSHFLTSEKGKGARVTRCLSGIAAGVPAVAQDVGRTGLQSEVLAGLAVEALAVLPRLTHHMTQHGANNGLADAFQCLEAVKTSSLPTPVA